MTVTNHAILVYVNGIDRTAYLQKGGLFVRLSIRNKNDTAELRFQDLNVVEGSTVSVTVNGTTIFGGIITNLSSEVLGQKPNKIVVTSCECRSWVIQLESSTLSQTFVQDSDDGIIESLFANYAIGFDYQTHVDQLDNDLDITFESVSLRSALDTLAAKVGAEWFISPDKELYWFSPSAPAGAAFDINCDNPDNATTFDVLNNSLKYQVDASNIINRILINNGSTNNPEKIMDIFGGDGSKDTFGPTTDYVDTVFYVEYTDTDDNLYTTWGSFVGYEPGDTLRKSGGQYNVVLTADRKSVRVQGNSGQVPKASTNVSIQYYAKQPINVTVDDLESQSLYGVYPVSVNNKNFDNEEEATAYANAILAENAYGKKTLSFDIDRYGLLPGTLLGVAVEELGIGDSANKYWLLENESYWLLENGDKWLLESSNVAQTFLIQEVSYQPVLTQTNQFMLVANVVCGKYQKDIIDTLSKLDGIQSQVGAQVLQPSLTKLSNISSNLGEIILGRATFTDGGTAKFAWDDPGGASGVVVGLEDTDGAYGAMNVYNAGTLTAKVGRLNNIGTVFGTVVPEGWGIYTENGYFSGVVAASQLLGGTVTGQAINGGTITGGRINGGTVSGGYVTGGTVSGALVIGGTVATSAPPINSSNTGVYLDSTGLYGYGSAGLTFRLSSDPAIKPYFSSGTIQEVVYEVTTNAVIRTGTSNPRIQIDNSGIFGWNSGGVQTLAFDLSSGQLNVVNGIFSGSVSASQITGGTVTGSRISGGTVTGAVFTGGTTTAGTVSASVLSGGTVSGSYISGGTIIGGTIAGTVSQSGIIRATGTAFYDTSFGTPITAGTTDIHGQGIVFKTNNTSTQFAQIMGWQDVTNGHYIASRLYKAGSDDFLVRVFSQTNTSSCNLQQEMIARTSGGQYSFFSNKAGTILLDANYPSAGFKVLAGTVETQTVKPATNNTYQLGVSTHGYTKLVLNSPNGAKWQLTVNNSGVLSVGTAT